MTPSDQTAGAAAPAGASIPYLGSELELFADATIWRAYWQSQITPFIGKRVLEVGAGLGSVVRNLPHLQIDRWLALEPDPDMAARLLADAASGLLPACCEPRRATTADLAQEDRFDTVLYIDVLEHIEDDRAELAHVVKHLDPGGTLIILAPAHQFLFSPFDAAIGHFRRYRLSSLLERRPPGTTLARARYLDAAGLLTSLGNRILLKQSAPTPAQIKLWDRVMVRLSRWIDPIFGFRLGKSVLVVWRKS
jgi:SAM-dependent methyltransferase